MSKAFTKEDVDPPERSGRVRSPSGLPPGAINYITADGARRLREELAKLQGLEESGAAARRLDLERVLASVTVVEPPPEVSESVAFGARVTLRDPSGRVEICRIVGVDEIAFEPEGVSWISPDGKTLLAAELGDRVVLEDGRPMKVIRIEYLAA